MKECLYLNESVSTNHCSAYVENEVECCEGVAITSYTVLFEKAPDCFLDGHLIFFLHDDGTIGFNCCDPDEQLLIMDNSECRYATQDESYRFEELVGSWVDCALYSSDALRKLCIKIIEKHGDWIKQNLIED